MGTTTAAAFALLQSFAGDRDRANSDTFTPILGVTGTAPVQVM